MAVDVKLKKKGKQYNPVIGSDGDFEIESLFDTALLMSIFCERRASASEVPESRHRRGWLGNEQGQDGFEIGSKIWLFKQSRLTASVLSDISKAAYNSLKWLIDDGFINDVSTEASLINGEVVLIVEIKRPGSKVEKRFFTLWNNTGIRG